jgi:N-acetylneuraminic acid mutarotase
MKTTISLFAVTAAARAALPPHCFTTLPPPPLGDRQEHSAAVIGTNIYMAGGMIAGRETNRLEVFDTAKGTWSVGPPLPAPLHHPNVAAVAGALYVLGGLAGAPWKSSGVALKYVPPATGGNGTWSHVAHVPEPVRGSAAVGVKGDSVYLVGGLAERGRAIGAVARFDAAAAGGKGAWTSTGLPQLPEGRDHSGAAVVGSTMYIVGGRNGTQTSFEPRSWALDLDAAAKGAGKWVQKASIPTPRGGVAVAQLGGRIFVFGGEGNAASAKGVFPQVEAYDPATDSWEAVKGGMAHPRHGNSAVTVGGKIYVLAGGAKQGGAEPGSIVETFGPC